MRPRPALVVAATSVVIIVAWPRPSFSWGFDVHRHIVERAIQLLPAAIRPFYERHKAFVIEHTIDPDLWRNVGFEEEPPRHFLELDAYGVYPFNELPRGYDAAVEKFGRERVQKNGLLPWRTVEIYGRLVKAFERAEQPFSSYALDDIKFFSAVVGHYVSDAHVPFHAVVNYDGQLTNQQGIHARFETELFRRYRLELRIRPAVPSSVRRPNDFMFDTLLASSQAVDVILRADRAAAARRDAYDDEYFDRFFQAARPALERRLGESITGVAAVIAGAWEQAGRPKVPLEPPRIIRKVPRSGN